MRAIYLPVAFLMAAMLGLVALRAQAQELPFPGPKDPAEIQKLAETLKSDASEFDKAFACKRLAIIGTKEAVDALASLLTDEKLSHYGRYGLEPIPDPAAGEALRNAMGKVKGDLLIGVITSIGVRKDEAAITELTKHLRSTDNALAAAAASALGSIGGDEAAAVLKEALASEQGARLVGAANGCLICAENLPAAQAAAMYNAVRKANVPQHVRIAATFNAILLGGDEGLALMKEQLGASDLAFFDAGIGAGRKLKAKEQVVEALLKAYADLPAERKAIVVAALGDLGQKAALPTVAKAAASDETVLKIAALRALGSLGDASVVAVLASAANADDEQVAQAAQKSLLRLKGPEVDAAIVAMLDSDNQQHRLVAISMAGERRIADALAKLMKAADDSDKGVRARATRALGEVVGMDSLALIAERVGSARDEDTVAAAKEALEAACIRMPDREVCAAKIIEMFEAAPPELKAYYLELLGTLGGQTALAAVAERARAGSDEVQDAATRVLGEWMGVDAAPVLLEIAKTHPAEKYQIRALRGYIRIARQLDMPESQRVEMYRLALAGAQRDDEKKLALDGLARLGSAEALAAAVEHVDNKQLQRNAIAAAVNISEKIVGADPQAVAKHMPKVVELTRGEQRERAQAVLNSATKKP
ncbi:MAG: HEAT repeat domain-containing protein [Planctomycetota bacterium]